MSEKLISHFLPPCHGLATVKALHFWTKPLTKQNRVHIKWIGNLNVPDDCWFIKLYQLMSREKGWMHTICVISVCIHCRLVNVVSGVVILWWKYGNNQVIKPWFGHRWNQNVTYMLFVVYCSSMSLWYSCNVNIVLS